VQIKLTQYLLADHLGSVEAVLDAAGVVRARLSFAAYGARRDHPRQNEAAKRPPRKYALRPVQAP
jgi:hypothetical protein